MTERIKWTERRFNFDFPVTYYPCIAERLSGTYARLSEKLAWLTEEQLALSDNGKWSVKEHIGHLTDLEELHEGRIDDLFNGLSVLRAADMKNEKTYKAGHNTRDVNSLLKEFRAARARFSERLDSMNARQLSLEGLHPRLNQPMRMVDLAFFVAEHDDHHLACITEIIMTIRKS
jgi:uncharacterized damage-inducible protein DinB